jgi:hypothetical protein
MDNETEAPAAASLTTTAAPTSSPMAAVTTGTNGPTAAPFFGGGDDTTTAPASDAGDGPTTAPWFDPNGGDDTTTTRDYGMSIFWPTFLLTIFIVTLALLLSCIINFDLRFKKHNARFRNRLIGTILFLAVLLSIATHASCDMWSLLHTTTTNSSSSMKNNMDDEWRTIKAVGIWGFRNDTSYGIWNIRDDRVSCQYDGNGYLDSRPHTTTARVMAVLATLAGTIAFMTYMAAQHDTKPKFLAAVSVVAAIFAIGCQAGAMTALFRALPCREDNNDEDNDLYDCTMWGSYRTATLGGIWPILSLTYWSTGAAVILYTIVRFDDDAIRPTDE